MEEQKERIILLRRFLDGVYTKEEVSQVLQYISETETNGDFDDLAAEVWDESAVNSNMITDVQREEYKREARKLLAAIERRRKHSWYRLGAIVASIAIFVVVTWGGINFIRTAFSSEITYLEVSTSYGEKKQLLLPDGTQFILNACSRVRYPKQFANHERKIELEGEGYFKVAHDEDMPFIIHTVRFDVRVLGTSFNVKSYESDEVVSVSVETGKVQVNLPEAMMKLIACEQFRINTISNEYNKRIDNELRVAAWIRGGLYFNSTPIRDVAKELERAYNCRITFDPNHKFENLISGEHDNKDLESVLRSIEYTSSIKYKRDGRNILLYK